ncbi:hypothetical protein MATL_G00263900 [Xyrichtys novacula]|uniref:DUF6729 domain-containing protein n=1 Tax=Xyrichtys novacula TaxID=13765 RepID=A0AAV1G774_XYRNO|nr:hypothetical protein MATL_G00263900 [Xyrichtys novacula]
MTLECSLPGYLADEAPVVRDTSLRQEGGQSSKPGRYLTPKLRWWADSSSERPALTPSRLKKSFSQRKMDKRRCLRKRKHIEEPCREEEIEGKLLLQFYVLGRDREVGVGTAAGQQAPSSAACGDLAGPSDTALLAAAAEVESQSSRDAPSQALLRAAVPESATPAAATAAVASPPHAGDEPTPPAATTGAQLLPEGWRQTLPEEQHEWLGQALFTRGARGQPVLTTDLRLWWYPPGDRPLYTQPPASSHEFFQSRFFLWLPYKMWAYRLVCPVCRRQLTGAGLYRTVRRVLDMSSWYFMGTEYLECCSCHRKYVAWAQDILEQLDLAHRERFPAVLTYKLSCDKAVIAHLKERTLGNSASRLHSILMELHTSDWIVRSMTYLSVLRKLGVPGAGQGQQVSLPTMHPVPGVSWLLSVYVRDALLRLDETKARITSIFGDILKMGSTKKMIKKLAGEAAGTAAWVTNVGNEHGQVLISVLTADKGDGLLPMAAGLVRRYRDAGKAHPKVLYVDQDCCSAVGQCKTSAMFSEWEQLVVHLDVWHIMCRFSRGVTTDSHQLFGLFMARLSFAIFEWDRSDVDRLGEAKRSEEGRDRDTSVHLSSRELARHCRRRTRRPEETERLVEELLDSFRGATDTMSVPLFDCEKMDEIWSTQRRHLRCIQDPPRVDLYTKTGEVTRGGVKLPVFRCARGSTSLESFHLHLCRFIPGTSANALHFQVYLLEGLARWNENRARAAVENAQRTKLRCYSAQLQHGFNQLTQEFLGVKLVENYTLPREYTGELIGMEYLYSQTGVVLQQDLGRDPDAPDGTVEVEEAWEEEEEGFQEEELQDLRFANNLSTLLQVQHLCPQPAAAAATTTSSSWTELEPGQTAEEGRGGGRYSVITDSQHEGQSHSTPDETHTNTQSDDEVGRS